MGAMFVLAALALAREPSTGERKPMNPTPEARTPEISFDEEQARAVVDGWNPESRRVARALIDEYGAPDALSRQSIAWMGKGKWYKTVVTDEAVEQNFPAPHKNVVTQYVRYKLPVDKLDDVANFNGSVTYDRTQGLLGVSGPDEKTNFFTANVVDEIVHGKRDVDAARQFYAREVKAYTSGKANEWFDGFRFEVPARSADPDQAFEPPRRGRAGS